MATELRLYVDSTRQTEYVPNDIQGDFHRSPAKFRCFSGGVGCGKTMAGAVETVKAMLQHPGSRGLIGRYTDSELKATSWHEFKTALPRELIAYENKADLLVRLKNGSEALGRHLQEEIKIRSLNLDWWWVDEATETGKRMYNQLKGRLRGKYGPRRGWLTCNPDSRDSWVYKEFVERFQVRHAYFHGRTKDATFLPPDYLASLYETYDDEWIARFLEGTWDTFQGMVFPMFNREAHVIPWTASNIPRDWPRYRGMDHGWSDPAVCVMAAADHQGAIYVYDLYYKRNKTVQQICEGVAELSGDHDFVYSVMDASTFRHESATGRTITDVYREHGLILTRALRNKVHSGIARLRNMLQPRSSLKHPVLPRTPGCRLYVCAHCVPLIKEFMAYRFPEGGGEDPIDKDNHAIDALRYLVMHHPNAAEEGEPRDLQAWWDHLAAQRRPAYPYADIIGNELAVN